MSHSFFAICYAYMRIAIDIRLLARGDATGIPGYTRDLVDHLISTPHGDTYTLFYNSLRREPLPQHWLNQPQVSATGGRIPNRLLNLSFGFLHWPHPAQLRTADVLLSPNLDILPPLPNSRVITFHDVSFIRYPEFFSAKALIWHRLQQYAQQARQATRIIAVSEFTKADLVSLLGLPAEKIDVVYSGINPMFNRPFSLSHQPTDQPTNRLTRPYFLYLGSLEPRKNIPLLINAFTRIKTDRRFRDYQLVLAGRPGYRFNEIKAAAERSPACADIIFLGSVRNEDRPHLYAHARAFIFPSWLEGFGFPPLEAQACGTPVIAANRASLPEILGSSAILVNPWSIDELAAAIIQIETDSKMRDTIQASGRTNAARFSWESAAQQTREVLHRAAH